MEREQHQTEIRDLQDQLSEMHDELDSAKRSEDREKGALIEVSGARESGDRGMGWMGELGAIICYVYLFFLCLWLHSARASYAIVCFRKIFNHAEE